MEITSKTQTLAQLFQPTGDEIYTVPNYQRNYSWKQEQIETLFNDIKDEDKGYYVGNVLLNSEKDQHDIIDGQQRLTTLSLFLLATYEILTTAYKDIEKVGTQENEFDDAKTDIRRYLQSGHNKTPRLTLIDNDQDVWKSITGILRNEKTEGMGRFTLYKRYSFVKNELVGKLDSLNQILAFYKKLTNVELLQISVPNLSDAYQVFTSLNSKGLPLTPLDLLKNVFLSKGGNVERWAVLKDIFEHNDELDEIKLTQFILNNYDGLENYVNGQSLTKGKIVKNYEAKFNDEASGYIEKLINRARIYVKIANDDVEYNFRLSGLAKLDATSSYPLLLNVLVNKDNYALNDDLVQKIVVILIKLYVRRNITLTPKASNLRHALLELKNHIYSSELKGEALVDYLREQIRLIAPTDEALKVSLLSEGIYDKNKKTTRFVLISLERKFGNFFNKANSDTLDEFTNKKGTLRWSIEHILPQTENLSEHWLDSISSGNHKIANEIQNENVHKIGNLSLTPYNSELSTKNFTDKVHLSDNGTEVGLSIDLFLNQSINKESSRWTIAHIEKRTEILSGKILELFKI